MSIFDFNIVMFFNRTRVRPGHEKLFNQQITFFLHILRKLYYWE